MRERLPIPELQIRTRAGADGHTRTVENFLLRQRRLDHHFAVRTFLLGHYSRLENLPVPVHFYEEIILPRIPHALVCAAKLLDLDLRKDLPHRK